MALLLSCLCGQPSGGALAPARAVGATALLRRGAAAQSFAWTLLHDVTLAAGEVTPWSASVARPSPFVPLGTLFAWRNGVLNGYSSTRVSLWDSLMFGRVLAY